MKLQNSFSNITLKICLNKLCQVKKMLTPDVRSNFVKAFVLSRLNYMCITYSTLPKYHINKIHRLIMMSGRYARGNAGFKVKCQGILNEFKMLNSSQTIYKSAITFIVKLMINKKPDDIYSLVKIPRRKCSNIAMICPPSSSHSSKFNYFPFLLKIYNDLNANIKTLPLNKQLRAIEQTIRICPDKDWLRTYLICQATS